MNRMRFRWRSAVSAAAVLVAGGLFLVFLWAGCSDPEPIRIGFVGGMTGRLSDLGVAGRNGVTLAIEEQEAAGGVQGHPLILLTRDDKQDPEVALQVDREFIDQGVVAIIGHMTSAMTKAVLPLINREGILMISPTASSNRFSKLDDGLIRVLPPNRAETDHLAGYAYEGLGLRNMTAICDLSNSAYSLGFVENFKDTFAQLGGHLELVVRFTSRPGLDFAKIAVSLLQTDPEGILIVAGAVDTAMICQHIRMQGDTLPLLSSGWAMTADLLHYGGKAVEGVVFSQLLDLKSREKRYVTFKHRYIERFGTEPGFAAVHGYEAARMLLDGLRKTLDPSRLKQAILDQETFFGVHEDFRLDPYGDPKRTRFLTTIHQGEYEIRE